MVGPGGDLDFDQMVAELHDAARRQASRRKPPPLPRSARVQATRSDRKGLPGLAWLLSGIGLVTFGTGVAALVLSNQPVAQAQRRVSHPPPAATHPTVVAEQLKGEPTRAARVH